MKKSTSSIFRVVNSLSVFVLSGVVNAYAQEAAPQAPSPFGSLVPLIVIFVIFYFFLIRPQQSKAKEHQKMLNALKKDDRVITSGGIYGTVSTVKGDIVEVKIAEGVKVQVAKSAISSVLPPEGTVTSGDEMSKIIK